MGQKERFEQKGACILYDRFHCEHVLACTYVCTYVSITAWAANTNIHMYASMQHAHECTHACTLLTHAHAIHMYHTTTQLHLYTHTYTKTHGHTSINRCSLTHSTQLQIITTKMIGNLIETLADKKLDLHVLATYEINKSYHINRVDDR